MWKASSWSKSLHGRVEKKEAVGLFHNKQYSKYIKECLLKRVHGEGLWAQEKPVDCPGWACINRNNSVSVNNHG